jgi:hypothetical protein
VRDAWSRLADDHAFGIGSEHPLARRNDTCGLRFGPHALGESNSVPNDLDSRRRAIARAFRTGGRSDELAELQRAVAALTQRVEELSREVEAFRRREPGHPQPALSDEEPPGGRVSVPPVTAARISNQAFDVLLGTVSRETEPESRIA